MSAYLKGNTTVASISHWPYWGCAETEAAMLSVPQLEPHCCILCFPTAYLVGVIKYFHLGVNKAESSLLAVTEFYLEKNKSILTF
jgi:hypothetical protein